MFITILEFQYYYIAGIETSFTIPFILEQIDFKV